LNGSRELMLDRLVKREDENKMLKPTAPVKPVETIEDAAKSYYRKYD
jgi:hypothetical protein